MTEQNQKLPMHSSRLEALGDGIFSVAMTILAIELELPVIKEPGLNGLLNALQHTWSGLLCYVISFVVLGIMWFGHRMLFEYIGKSNRYFIFLGVLFYMIVCLVPFSTRLLAHATLQWYAIMIYGLNLSLCNISLYAQWLYGINKPTLMTRELPIEVKKEAKVLFLISPVVYAIAFGISFWKPQISIGIFVITPILYLLPNKLDKYMP
jgi:uncharacterized membrane protein